MTVAGTRREAKVNAARMAHFMAQLASERPADSPDALAWTTAADGSCPLLGPVARWLRARGQTQIAVPPAARNREEFIERLESLVRFVDDLAARAQALADNAINGYAALDARAARCLDAAAAVRHSMRLAMLESERSRLMVAATDAVQVAIAALETFCG